MEQKLTHISEARDWSPNITNLNEQLLLGPQREILEIIESINRRWGLDLNATRTYRWGPGYMDKIKKWYRDHYVEEHMKRKISTFFNKINEKSWSTKDLEKNLRLVDEKMATRRSNGAVFQDNSELLEEKLGILSERVESQLNEANKQFNSSGININASLYHYENTNRFDTASKNEYIIEVSLPPGNMNLFVGNNPYKINIGASILWFRMDLMKLIYTICNQNSTIANDDTFELNYVPYASTGNKIVGHYFPEWDENSLGRELRHPYISGKSSWNQLLVNNDLDAAHVCLGELAGNIDAQLKKLDLVSLCATLMLWNSTFHVGRTHPLNQLDNVFWGISPENNVDEFKNAINRADPASCNHNNTEEGYEINTMYCDDIQCVFKDTCNTYKAGNGTDQEPAAVSLTREIVENHERPSIPPALEVMIDQAQRFARDEAAARDGEPDVDEGYRRIEEDNETPEERVIRWAAEHGGAINIGER